MTPESERASRPLRAIIVVCLVGLGAILLWRVERRPAAPAAGTVAEDVTGDQARPSVWRRLWGGGERPAPPLPLWRLTGRVVDGSARPVPNVQVRLAQPARTTVSAADGGFAFDGLVAGAYDVEARAGDRVGGPVRAHVGSDGKPVLLRLYRGAQLELEVVSAADGHAIADADVEVRVMQMHDGAGTQRGRTGQDGKVRFSGAILIGSEAWAAAPGFAAALQPLDPSAQADGVWRARVELVPGATFAGRVVDEGGAPIAGAVVEAASAAGGGARAGTTDARFGNVHPLAALLRRQGVTTGPDGRFQLALAGGAWRLAASHPRYQTVVSPRLVSDGKSGRDDLTLVMPAGVRVRGRVVRTDGQPAPGARVQVRWQVNARVEREVQADGDGRFLVVGLPPALLSFQALAEHASSLPVHLDLEYPPKLDVVLTLANDGVISGTVVDDANNPLPDVDVVYVEHSPSMLLTRVQPAVETTDAAGRFVIHGLSPTATYSLNAKRPQDGDAAFRVATVDATPGQDVTIRIPGDGSVVGRVVRAGGGSLSDVTVEVLDGGRPPQPIGADGRFRLDNLFARAYTLHVTAPDAGFRNVPVTVAAGQVADVGTVSLPRARRVAGVVRRADGQPAFGAIVRIDVAGDAQPLQAFTGRDGRFSASAPADAELTLSANDRRLGQTAPVHLGAGDPANAVELAFAATGSVEGTLTAGGKPLAHHGVIAAAAAPGAGGAAPAVRSAQSDETGYYRIDGLPAGDYDVQLAGGDPRADAVSPQRVRVTVGEKTFASFELPPAK